MEATGNSLKNVSLDHKLLVGLDVAAEMMDISRRELDRKIAGGEFPKPVKIGRLSKVPVDDVVGYVEKLKSARGVTELIVR